MSEQEPSYEDGDEQQSNQRIQMLADGLHGAIDYSRMENRISYAEVVGALETVKFDMLCEARGLDPEEEG